MKAISLEEEEADEEGEASADAGGAFQAVPLLHEAKLITLAETRTLIANSMMRPPGRARQ